MTGINKNSITSNRPELFVPSNRREMVGNGQAIVSNGEDVIDTNIDSTGSFRYDPPGAGLKSTQQLNVDWSRFENHTFFNSAEVNTNVATERIINEFPFDGTRKETEAFFDRLTGFEKWVYDNWPKNKGYLKFDSSLGTFIEVTDFAGTTAPTLSKNSTGAPVMDPGTDSFTLEMQLLVPAEENGDQVICQKISGTLGGFTVALLSSSAPETAPVLFTVASGSAYLNASATLQRGRFNHLAVTYDRSVNRNDLRIYVDESLAGISETQRSFEVIDFKRAPLTIGSGSAWVTSSGVSITPDQTLSGALDEFRYFHSTRTPRQQELFASKAIYPDDDLVLYYKFNEPSGTLGSSEADQLNRIVIDSSGNGLHSYINAAGWDFSLRSTSSIPGPMVNERLDISPVLFPGYTDLVALNTELLTSAAFYDSNNPNLITRLVPPHYFLEGQSYEGLASEDGTIGDSFTGTGNAPGPGTGELGTAQMLSSFLYVWAKFFDEMKLMTDGFVTTLRVGYDPEDTVPDQFLLRLAEFYGFRMPGFFSSSELSQFVEAENIVDDVSTGITPLRAVQNQILRRILTSLRDIINSKGTLHSVKSFFRATGIDPDNTLRIREFGGPSIKTLSGLREKKTEVSSILSMTGTLNEAVTSPYLSASKIEPPDSFPASFASHVAGVIDVPQLGGGTTTRAVTLSPSASDGYLTSGSWTYEGIYSWPLGQTLQSATQSLCRMMVTGTAGNSQEGSAWANLIALSGSAADDPFVKLYLRPGTAANIEHSPLLELVLTGADIFDGRKWHLTFGRNRNDEIGSVSSGSYFLRAQNRDIGALQKVYATASFFLPAPVGVAGDVQSETGIYNTSGSFFVIGSGSIGVDQGGSAVGRLLGDTALVTNGESRTTAFEGRVGHIRFWSKGLSEAESAEHARNFRSLGVSSPATNFNFVDTVSGSWERLRIDASTDQPLEDRVADANGVLRIFDFSQNELHLQGTGFASGSTPIRPEIYNIDGLSTLIDESSTTEKVRVRSFQSFDNVRKNPLARVGPVYELPAAERPQDDTRFSIDFSLVDALNRDIVSIFATLDEFDQAIGNPNVLFSQDYPDMEALQDVYFNRLSGKLNVKSFEDFFRWIDTSVGTFVEQLIPRKTKFLGMNFVVENHMLERPRVEYRYSDSYLGERLRLDKGVILLQQIVGTIKRY